MRKVFSLLVLLLAISTSAVAEQLSPEAALARLNAGKMKVAGVSKERLRLVHTAEQQDVRLFYIFQNADDGRSLILGADDLLPAVMAYGINAFDVNRMPAQVSEWLDFYEESSLQTILSSKPLKAPIQGNAVAPLVSSKWDQMDPYNRLCVEKMQRNMPVGCVATAMAQLMYFWKYPARGTGSHSYTASTGTLLSANFGSTEYPWDKMKDCYGVHAIDGSSEMEDTPFTDEEADAVSLLMYHCGVAVDMQYAEAGSGAYDSDAAAAMINYFGYDKGIKQTYRAVCTDDEWQQMLLDELSQGRPMFYSAHTRNNEGHSFICDGFDGKGYFHFNWGWGGRDDAWCAIGALNTTKYAFNNNNNITDGFYPADNEYYLRPNKVTGLTIEESQSLDAVTLSWTNPVTDIGGGALDAFDSVIIRRDFTRIAEFSTSAPGETCTFVDQLPEPGNYEYSVYVVNQYGNSIPVYQRIMVGPKCDMVFNMADAGGDGWKGASISVVRNGVRIAIISMTQGSEESRVVPLLEGDLSFYWNKGWFSGDFFTDDEISFTISDADENILYSSQEVLVPGKLFDYNNDCYVTSVDDAALATEAFALFPNPSNGVVTAKAIGLINITLFDVMGQQIISFNTDNDEVSVDVSDLCNGVYFISMKTNDRTLVKKILISK